MNQEVLEKMQRILGDDHPNTISAMSNLAIKLGDQHIERTVTQCKAGDDGKTIGLLVVVKKYTVLGDVRVLKCMKALQRVGPGEPARESTYGFGLLSAPLW